MSIDLSQYEGLHALRATANIGEKPSWCLIIVNVDDDPDTPHLVAWDEGQLTWANNRGECNRNGVEIISVLGELVLPGSLEPPCCDPLQTPATCTISSDCPETTVDKLINTIKSQHSMLIDLVEKLVDSK